MCSCFLASMFFCIEDKFWPDLVESLEVWDEILYFLTIK